MDDNPEIRDRLNVNKSTYHNKRPRERFICFIRGAKWIKINQLNGPSPIHDTSTWLSQSMQSIIHVCYWLGMQKNLPWKCFRTAFGHHDFRSTSASQQAWRMPKRYHLLLREREVLKVPWDHWEIWKIRNDGSCTTERRKERQGRDLAKRYAGSYWRTWKNGLD